MLCGNFRKGLNFRKGKRLKVRIIANRWEELAAGMVRPLPGLGGVRFLLEDGPKC